MQTHNQGVRAAAGLLLLTMVAGCAEWDSHPVVVQQNYGRAVNNMVKNQTLYPEHGQNDRPLLSLDGQKAEGVINAYRAPAMEPIEKTKEGVKTFNVGDVGGNQ